MSSNSFKNEVISKVFAYKSHTHTHIYIYIYVCVCVYVCVRVCVCKQNLVLKNHPVLICN